MENKTILFPTDFSGRADKALEEAIRTSIRNSAKLTIYHVYHRPVDDSKHGVDLDELLRKTEARIDEEFRLLPIRHPDLKKIDYECQKELGVSVHEIVNKANRENYSLIILATKGAKGFGELLGSKTAKIIKSVKTPVLVFPDNTTLKGIEKIALACDYSEKSDLNRLALLVDVAEQFEFKVDVISLNRDERTMTDKEEQVKQEIRTQLEKLPNSFNYSFSDNVEKGILEYARSHDIGIIAIVPKSYNFMERLFHESLTTRLAFHSPIPLLVL